MSEKENIDKIELGYDMEALPIYDYAASYHYLKCDSEKRSNLMNENQEEL